MERSLGLAFTTLTIFAPLAHAAHPQQAVKPEGFASVFEFVATARPLAQSKAGGPGESEQSEESEPGGSVERGRSFGPEGSDGDGRASLVFARQVLPAQRTATERAQSRVIYLNPDGVILRPGNNDSSRDISSIVAQPTLLPGWDTDFDTWLETALCVAELYAPFDVTVTDEDPGDVPHIEVVLGGSPGGVGLPDDVAGVSPFTSDCSIVERSIVFAFTDVIPDDPRTICEVIAQEVAHSYGLDHERLAADPMSYLDYDGDRRFQDRMASCGEFADRTCGINGTTCRLRQNSVALLNQRLGRHPDSRPREGGADGGSATDDATADAGFLGGCTAAGGSAGYAMALAYLGVFRRRRQ